MFLIKATFSIPDDGSLAAKKQKTTFKVAFDPEQISYYAEPGEGVTRITFRSGMQMDIDYPFEELMSYLDAIFAPLGDKPPNPKDLIKQIGGG